MLKRVYDYSLVKGLLASQVSVIDLEMLWPVIISSVQASDGRRLNAPNPSPAPISEAHEESSAETAHGTYPVFFDVNFDEERSRKMIDVVRDGFYIEPTHTAGVDVQFLLYHQQSDMITYVGLAFTLEESGSVFVHKTIEVFAVNP